MQCLCSFVAAKFSVWHYFFFFFWHKIDILFFNICIFWSLQNFGICLFFCIPQLDNHEIAPGKSLKINISVPNLRLFVGNIPKSKGKEEILEEFGKLTGKVQKNYKTVVASSVQRGARQPASFTLSWLASSTHGTE